MHTGSRLIQVSIKHPKLITLLMIVVTIILGFMTIKVEVDTDPENMLSEDEAVRVFHNRMKKEFDLNDVVVLGIVNEEHPEGVFNPVTLKHVQELTEFVWGLSDPDDPDRRVVTRNLIAPGNVDTIEQAGLGQVRFEWLMKEAPETQEGAIKIRNSAMDNPLLKGTLVSEDGKAIGIYIPITAKDFAYDVRKRLIEKIETLDKSNGDHFYCTGLPVAEDTFGVEMFVQMAVSAPLAMLAIFVLMLIFFKKVKLIISPMIIAIVSVICTMGLLIGTGNTLHIMSSMIPIFLMPIAVVDSIHILSEFYDAYKENHNRKQTIEHAMDELFRPMLFTSLTSSAGFASLALTPIPPVQVFGVFVAFGIMLAWLLTIFFIPAYVMMLSEKGLAGMGVPKQIKKDGRGSMISRFLRYLSGFTYRHAKLIISLTFITLLIAVYGITQIRINDNPVKWFKKNHPIREADTVLNRHFGGTYEAYLILESSEQEMTTDMTVKWIKDEIHELSGTLSSPLVIPEALESLNRLIKDDISMDQLIDSLMETWEGKQDLADNDEYDAWSEVLDILGRLENRGQVFKRPDVLYYVDTLQDHLLTSGVVGKSNSITNVVKKVHQELFEGNPDYYRVPDSVPAVAQCLISYQNSHKPNDLFHLVTPDYQKANIWIQMKTGDNKDMEAVVRSVNEFMVSNPPPVALSHKWAGLTYLNIVWQDKMVTGMLKSFLGSFVVVLVLMTFLFQSPSWGLIAMVPLSVTIALIYGIIGMVGKDYDMPVAVLSSLTLGMAIDFAIHFLERSRMVFSKTGTWEAAIKEMFEEPGRAIARNVIVIAVGFTPLLAAPLVPYITVGVFLASIMALSGIGTLLILPSLITILQSMLFRKLKGVKT
ncbi:MAG: MMPL family transporter [Deltaproteobacteria bacterium]|nr:MMPL family transporter [Deltaproteobacteria bacterium]